MPAKKVFLFLFFQGAAAIVLTTQNKSVLLHADRIYSR
jgi:hypothetical protein